MEPINNNPSTGTQEAEMTLTPASSSQVSLSSNQDNQLETSIQPTNTGDEDTNAQIIERLKEQRDQLRGIDDLSLGEKPKKSKLKKLLILLLILGASIALYIFITKSSANNPMELVSTSQKNFLMPSNLASKTSEEKQALNIIALARQNKADDLINTYLNKAQLGQSETDFKALVASYSTSADGEQVELIEKKVGKVDFASTGESSAIADTTSEFEAASLVYKSSYYKHTNNIYLKINLYKPDPTVDNWKMYSFEFKSGDQTSPLKAEVNIPT